MSSTPPTPTLQLFYSPGACSFVPHVTLLEANLSAELILARVGSMTPEFEEINPKRRVPVLVLDGKEIITEMAAVLTAISSLVPHKHLLGEATLETIRVYEWLNYLSTVAHAQAFGSMWRPERFSDDESVFPAIRAKGKRVIREVYGVVEGKVAGKEFAVGSGFTAVDAFLVVLYCWARRIGVDVKEEFPGYAVYAERLLQRESVRRAREVHVDV
ncbi:hypothetical protein BJY04DRAFT_228160 [Aspergillus karnatakaensis]|uniref:uncharacterized protein n=1 Tax=Aspergillus karnatakaensis TaxID=1810916 RepID=UPI003CCCC89A